MADVKAEQATLYLIILTLVKLMNIKTTGISGAREMLLVLKGLNMKSNVVLGQFLFKNISNKSRHNF